MALIGNPVSESWIKMPEELSSFAANFKTYSVYLSLGLSDPVSASLVSLFSYFILFSISILVFRICLLFVYCYMVIPHVRLAISQTLW